MWQPGRIFASERSRRTALLVLAAVVVAMVALSVLVNRQVPWLSDPDAIRAWVRGFGVLAPAAFVALQVVQVLVAPIPGHVMALVSGYLFGTWEGFLYSMVGVVVGSTAAFLLAVAVLTWRPGGG